MGSSDITFFIAFIAGLLSFISPCVLPLVPAYIGYLTARATAKENIPGGAMLATAGVAPVAGNKPKPGTATARVNRLIVFLHGVAFVSGFTAVFVFFGMFVNLLTSALDIKDAIAKIGGVLVIIFGLHVLGLTSVLLRFFINRVRWEGDGVKVKAFLERIYGLFYVDTRRQMNPRNPYGYFGSAMMGMIFAAGWSPCLGPILGGILALSTGASDGGTWLNGGFLLLAYSLGLGVPFLVAALAINQVRSATKGFQRYVSAVDKVVSIPFAVIAKVLAFVTLVIIQVPLRKARAIIAKSPMLRVNTVELISGVFLIFVGYLLISGELTRLATTSSGFASFTYNLEGCGTGVFKGEVPLADFGTCMSLGINYKERLARGASPEITSTPAPTTAATLSAAPQAGLNVGQVIPDFTVSTLAGKKINIQELRGKVVILNFWATWCDPCKVELPFFQTMHDKYGKDGLVVLAIDYRETEAMVLAFVEQYGYKFTIGMDQSGALGRQFNALGLPLSFIVGRDGVIQVKQSGPFALDTLDAKLKDLLGG